MIIVVPAPTPVTTPEMLPIVATAELVLVQVPPVVESEREVEPPVQIVVVPLIPGRANVARDNKIADKVR